MKPLHVQLVLLGASTLLALPLAAQKPVSTAKPADTEVWEPVPAIVTPGAMAGDAPSDAIRLLDGDNLAEWVNTNDKAPAGWMIAGGVMTVNKPVGNIETKRRFRNYQLHLEWRVPSNITGTEQGRGNSGIFLASTGPGDDGYELQILDSYQNKTYVNGQAASIYKQSVPLANPSRRPGEWQTYDVVWTAPVFGATGQVITPAAVTVLYNGVLVQNHYVLKGGTRYIGAPEYAVHGDSPIKLQAHGDKSEPLSFRNIWIRPLP